MELTAVLTPVEEGGFIALNPETGTSSRFPHPVMPKLPRISGAQAQRALERLGFVKLRRSGSHVIMRRESKGCVVPMHAELKVGSQGWRHGRFSLTFRPAGSMEECGVKLPGMQMRAGIGPHTPCVTC